MLPSFPKVDKKDKSIEGIKIQKLISDFGSPLFVISERIIMEKYRLFSETLTKYYPNSQIAYSVKTNYLAGIVKIMKNLGCWAEVVSGFEYWLAKKIGFQPDQIIFNGPSKIKEDIENALKDGAMLNVDNENEIHQIIQISKNLSGRVNIGLRVNAKIGPNPWSRFGFNLENAEAYRTIKSVSRNHSNISIRGLHIHIGTNINDPNYYFQAAEKISDLALKIKNDLNIDLDYLDLGGGFSIPGARWINAPIWIVPEINEFIKIISQVLNKKFADKKPQVLFEPGRYLVDEAGIFLTEVSSVKQTDFGQLINVNSSAYSQLPVVQYRKNIIDVIKKDEAGNDLQESPALVGGNSCVGNDFLAQDVSLPKTSEDDILIFYNVGSYAPVRGEQWIHPRPAVVMIEKNGNIKCLRRKEDYENMITLDEF